MKQNLTDLVKADDLHRLYLLTFQQTLVPAESYPKVLDEETENAVIRRTFGKESGPWLLYMDSYLNYYSLYDSSFNLLIAHMDRLLVKRTVCWLIEKQGLTYDQFELFCEKVLQIGDNYFYVAENIMKFFCTKSKNYDERIYRQITILEQKYKLHGFANLYRDSHR